MESARRRLAEELGLGVGNAAPDALSERDLVVGRLVEAAVFVYRAADPKSGLIEHEYDHVLVGTVERRDGGSPDWDDVLPFAPDEVEEVAWISIDEAERVAAEDEPGFAPWFAEALALALASLAADPLEAEEDVGAERLRERGSP